jgi:NADH:ubiquinone oxidoreductase subunit K
MVASVLEKRVMMATFLLVMGVAPIVYTRVLIKLLLSVEMAFLNLENLVRKIRMVLGRLDAITQRVCIRVRMLVLRQAAIHSCALGAVVMGLLRRVRIVMMGIRSMAMDALLVV